MLRCFQYTIRPSLVGISKNYHSIQRRDRRCYHATYTPILCAIAFQSVKIVFEAIVLKIEAGLNKRNNNDALRSAWETYYQRRANRAIEQGQPSLEALQQQRADSEDKKSTLEKRYIVSDDYVSRPRQISLRALLDGFWIAQGTVFYNLRSVRAFAAGIDISEVAASTKRPGDVSSALSESGKVAAESQGFIRMDRVELSLFDDLMSTGEFWVNHPQSGGLCITLLCTGLWFTTFYHLFGGSLRHSSYWFPIFKRYHPSPDSRLYAVLCCTSASTLGAAYCFGLLPTTFAFTAVMMLGLRRRVLRRLAETDSDARRSWFPKRLVGRVPVIPRTVKR